MLSLMYLFYIFHAGIGELCGKGGMWVEFAHSLSHLIEKEMGCDLS